MAEKIFISYGFQTVSQKHQNCEYFDTITIINCDAKALNNAFLEQKINIRLNGDKSVSLSFSELSGKDDLE